MRAKPRDRVSFTVTTVVDNPPSPLSAARVASPSSEKHARKMRFRIAKISINRSRVNCHQSRFWFQIPRKTPSKISFPREAPLVDLGCPCLVVLRLNWYPMVTVRGYWVRLQTVKSSQSNGKKTFVINRNEFQCQISEKILTIVTG
jgi:hypothetical protein